MLLNLNVIHTHSNWLCWKSQEKFQVESRFCKAIGCSYVTLYTTYLVKKTMFRVSNRNTRKRCLLISRITLKTSERRHLTISYLPEVTVQNHIWTVFPRIYTNLQSKVCFQFCFQVRRPVISIMADPYTSFYEKWEWLQKYLIHEKFKMSAFFISENTAPKMDKFLNFLPYIQRAAISVSQS